MVDVIEVFSQVQWDELDDQTKTIKAKRLFDMAIRIAIDQHKVQEAFDLIHYAKEHGFYLAVTEAQVEVMIKEKMYDLIETLVMTNSLLKIDPHNLDVDDLFQVQQIAQKNKKDT